MKKTIAYISIAFSFLFVIASCNKNDFDFEAELKEQQRRDSIERVRVKGIIENQAAGLKAFADEKIPGATLVDSLGIWFRVDAVGQVDSYTYTFNPNGGITAPEVTVKYKGTLLNGTVFDQTEEGKTVNFNLASTIQAWHIAFLPKTISYNGTVIPVTGLTTSGLKKGSKIQFITSSPWAYDTKEVKDKDGKVTIPANSPLYFEIEVVDIK